MRELARKVLGRLHFTLEQVQDLTPTPMTLSSVMFYTGENPYTHEPVYVARTQEEKRRQKSSAAGSGKFSAKGSAKNSARAGQTGRTERFDRPGQSGPSGRSERFNHSNRSEGREPRETTSSERRSGRAKGGRR